MRRYLLWAAAWQRLRTKSRPEEVWAYYTSLPEWHQAALFFGSIFLLIGSYLVVQAAIELSDPFEGPEVVNVIESVPEAEKLAAVEADYESALSQIENEKYTEALETLGKVPADYEDTKELKSTVRAKLAEAKDLVRYEPTYQAGLAAIRAGNYPEAITQFERITANGLPYTYKDTQDLIAQVVGLSQGEDLEIATAAGEEYDELQLEQRERKALRIYNLAFIRNSAIISDQVYRAREVLISVTNGWRDPSAGITAIDSALGAVDEAIINLELFAAPTPVDDLHDDYMALADDLRGELSATRSTLDPYVKNDVKTQMADLDGLNDQSNSVRTNLVAEMDGMDDGAIDGDIFTPAEVDLNLSNER